MSEVLKNNDLSEENLQQIVKGLLNAVKELGEKKINVRKIKPENVFFSEDFEEIMFTDTTMLTCKDEDNNQDYIIDMPYNSLAYKELNYISSVCHKRDLWAIGIILLEIFVGSDILHYDVSYKGILKVWDMTGKLMSKNL